MTRNFRILDGLRFGLTPLENHLVDGLMKGQVGRREFIRHGSMLGLSLPLLGSIGVAAGFGVTPAVAQTVKSGATIRVGVKAPTVAVDPLYSADEGGICMLQQVGEFLCIDGPDLVLRPCLATSWKPNQDGTVWTFELRKGVKFHSGGEMKADDVVATFERLVDPKNASKALSVYKGLLQKGGTRKVDDYTVQFHLDAANGNFPYLVSSDTYSAIILPASYKGDFEKVWDGTGPFRNDKYTPKVSASFVPNPNYWGPKPLPARVEFTYFADIQPEILAFQGGQIDIINALPAADGVALLTDPKTQIISVKSAANQMVHMRCDMDPFRDPRVRRAVALCIDRDKLVKGLMKGHAVPGNDSPFAPVYPSTDSTVAQRQRDISQAKALMRAAGAEKGFDVAFTAQQHLEIPIYAQLIQSWLKDININVKLSVMDYKSYIGDALYGKSPWLDSVFGGTAWFHRGVPNVLLSGSLHSAGAWNASHFKNEGFDLAMKNYVAALDLEAKRNAAGKIQRLLLEETPAIYGYFYNHLTAVRKGVAGVQPNAMNQLFLSGAGQA